MPDKDSPSAKITNVERLRILSFIVRSITFKIFLQAPDSPGGGTILAAIDEAEELEAKACRNRK